jgi:hypothetical protein
MRFSVDKELIFVFYCSPSVIPGSSDRSHTRSAPVDYPTGKAIEEFYHY